MGQKSQCHRVRIHLEIPERDGAEAEIAEGQCF